jgi:hypothetical protein
MNRFLLVGLAFAAALVAAPSSASVPPTAAAINIDGLDVMPRDALVARFPDLSEREVDRLLFRIADARSMALYLAKVN